MGAITSSLREIYFSIRALLAEIADSNADFNEVLSRISSSPGIPVPHATEPFWLEDPPFPHLVDVQSPEGLPETADVVVIGSGITGASVARTVLRECARLGVDRRVVMLEARTVCSGATGRNGGHVKVSPWEEVRALKRRGITGERAWKIVEFQRRHLRVLLDLCEAEGMEAAELREVETVDLFVDGEGWEEAKDSIDELGKEKGMEGVDWGSRVWEGEEAREVSRLCFLECSEADLWI
jgi:glycine/D-amino acid oxidase-like deaminating enzyme